jgi:hypothetical protein
VLEVRPAQLLNISTRMRVLTGDKVLIGGLIITGTEPKKVISDLRSPGAGALQDTTLEVYNGNGALLASNDDWKVRADGTSQEAEINAITIPPADNRESAVAITLAPGNYTAVVRGKGGTTGVSLIEVYHLQ